MDDEKFYQIIADEIRDGRINDAVWTKAIAKSMGDDNKTKAVYIQLRVEQLMQEETRSKIEERLDESRGNFRLDEAENEADSKDDESIRHFGKYIGTVILIIIILFVVKTMVWPKVQTYF